jgi:hypothetical protein
MASATEAESESTMKAMPLSLSVARRNRTEQTTPVPPEAISTQWYIVDGNINEYVASRQIDGALHSSACKARHVG